MTLGPCETPLDACRYISGCPEIVFGTENVLLGPLMRWDAYVNYSRCPVIVLGSQKIPVLSRDPLCDFKTPWDAYENHSGSWNRLGGPKFSFGTLHEILRPPGTHMEVIQGVLKLSLGPKMLFRDPSWDFETPGTHMEIMQGVLKSSMGSQDFRPRSSPPPVLTCWTLKRASMHPSAAIRKKKASEKKVN